MKDPWPYVVALPIAYIVGSMSFGLLIGRLRRGVDVRRYGSGSSGTTNVLRTMGVRAALLVMALDGAKGAIAVLVARWLDGGPLVESLAATLAVTGHIWPVFTKFEGGRGVITGFIALLVISPIAGGFALIGLLIAGITRYVSVGSMAGTTLGVGSLFVLIIIGWVDIAYLIFGSIGYVSIMARHRGNIVRLARGSENRLSRPSRPKRKRDER